MLRVDGISSYRHNRAFAERSWQETCWQETCFGVAFVSVEKTPQFSRQFWAFASRTYIGLAKDKETTKKQGSSLRGTLKSLGKGRKGAQKSKENRKTNKLSVPL